MAFPEKFIKDLRDRSDIVSVVGEYVRLIKKSGGDYVGLCPFHNEKTPSFIVHGTEQYYHCFGCGKGGGVINFVMDMENLRYPEAVEHLAKRAGMQMPEELDNPEGKKRLRILALNRDAARFFYEQLSGPSGSSARAYIAKRQISPKYVKNFGLGAAPDSWDSLRNAMKEKGYTDFELFDAGLVKKGKSGGFYDTFRNRLMFPIIDVRGDVIGFSGRALGEDDRAKYLNSPQTPVFDKGRSLFALNLAKKSKKDYFLLSEGNIDIVMMHQAGIDCAVAGLGTAFTPDQARLLSRYKSQVILAYDNDEAGLKASKKAISILEKLDVKVRVLQIKGAKDPDEFIKTYGADAFLKLIEDSENQLDYLIKKLQAQYDLNIDDQKVDFLHSVSELVAKQPDSVKRQVYSMRIAEICGVKSEAVTAEVERRRKLLLNRTGKAEQRALTNAEALLQPTQGMTKYDDPASAAAEEGLIRLLYLDPELIRLPALPEADEFSSPTLGKLYALLTERIRAGDSLDIDLLTAELEPDEMSLLISLLQKPEKLSLSRQSAGDYIAKIRDRRELRSGEMDVMALLRKRQNENNRYGG